LLRRNRRRMGEVSFGSCVTSAVGPYKLHATVQEMKEGPSGSAIMS